jgi:hypothetical protein
MIAREIRYFLLVWRLDGLAPGALEVGMTLNTKSACNVRQGALLSVFRMARETGRSESLILMVQRRRVALLACLFGRPVPCDVAAKAFLVEK